MIREKITIRRLIIFFVIIIVAAIVLFLLNRESRTSIGQVLEIPGSSSYSSVDVDESSVIFSNGRFIARYSNAGIEKLSNTKVLPPVEEIQLSPEKDFVLFRTATEKLESLSLFEKLNEGTVSADSYYWWVAEIKTGKVSSVSTHGAYQVKWSGKDTLIYTAGETLIEYSASDNSHEEIGRFNVDIVDFKPYPNSILVLTSDKKIVKFTTSSSAPETIYDPATAVEFGTKEGCFLVFHGHGTEGGQEHSESELVGCSDETLQVAQENVYTPRFTEDGKYFVYYDNEVYRYVDLTNGKQGILGSSTDMSGLYLLKALSLEKLILVSDSSFLMSNNPFSYKPISSNKGIPMGNIVIDVFKNKQTIEASKQGDYSDKERKAVIDKVASEGYDPDIYTIIFNVLEPEGYRW